MDPDRLRGALLTIIRDATRALKLTRLTRARAVLVHESGALDVQPETAGAAPHVELPLRFGLPGVLRAVAKAGARVLVGHVEADPSQPFVAAWEPGALDELAFDVEGGPQPLARSGDTVACGTLVLTSSGTVVGYIPPGGPTIPTPPGGSTIALSGIITGTSRVKA